MSSPDSLPVAINAGSLARLSSNASTNLKPRRPCDACRKRKSRCEIQDGDTVCVLCKFHRQLCQFTQDPLPRKRRKVSESHAAVVPITGTSEQVVTTPNAIPLDPSADAGTPGSGIAREQRPSIRLDQPIDDYANLKGPSLLKKTLGLQNHRHSKILGKTSQFDHTLLSLASPNSKSSSGLSGEIPLGPSFSLRKVTPDEAFLLIPDSGTSLHENEQQDLDAIESLVAPHGAQLIHLYFRIVHPSFPILHKKVYLEKYRRTHREFTPPSLAAVYLLAMNWWSYSPELSLLPKPDIAALEALAAKTMSYVISRPKLSTIQAGLLLLQRPEAASKDSSWALTGQLVSLGQDLGLHQDCSKWRIPQWERGLRKRLGWALFMQDKWGALMHGRPSHIHQDDWFVRPVSEADFPEKSGDEGEDEEGSTEVENGRILFCEMIKLTLILARVLSTFYTLRAEDEFRQREKEGMGCSWVLEKAKGIQVSLKDWYSQLDQCLRMQSLKPRKLSSTGYLHLAYLATEITLHRHLLRSLSTENNPQLISVVRAAAHERLTSATDFVKSLRPEHLQSFWYCASAYSFSLMGAFIGLLWATSRTKPEAEGYRERLDEYRWTLRLSSRSAEILERAASLLASSTAVLVKGVPAHLEIDGSGSPGDDDGDYDSDVEDGRGEDGHVGGYESSAGHISVDIDGPGSVVSPSLTSPVASIAGLVNGAGAGASWDPESLGMQLASPTEYFWPELALPGSGYEVADAEFGNDSLNGF